MIVLDDFGLGKKIPLDSVQGEGLCCSSWLLIIIERVKLLMRFHDFCKIMGLIESGPAALSGSKELTASSSRLGS